MAHSGQPSISWFWMCPFPVGTSHYPWSQKDQKATPEFPLFITPSLSGCSCNSLTLFMACLGFVHSLYHSFSLISLDLNQVLCGKEPQLLCCFCSYKKGTLTLLWGSHSTSCLVAPPAAWNPTLCSLCFDGAFGHFIHFHHSPSGYSLVFLIFLIYLTACFVLVCFLPNLQKAQCLTLWFLSLHLPSRDDSVMWLLLWLLQVIFCFWAQFLIFSLIPYP